MFNTFEFYRRQIEDFNRNDAELINLIENLSDNDYLSNEEYGRLYDLALQKIKTLWGG